MFRSHVIINNRAIFGPLAAIRTLEARWFAAVVHPMPRQVPVVNISLVAAHAGEPLRRWTVSENASLGTTWNRESPSRLEEARASPAVNFARNLLRRGSGIRDWRRWLDSQGFYWAYSFSHKGNCRFFPSISRVTKGELEANEGEMGRTSAGHVSAIRLSTTAWSTRPDRDDTFGYARKCSAWISRACRSTGTDTWAPCRTRGAGAASCSSSGWSRGCSVGSSDSCSRSTLCAASWRRSGGHLKNSKSRVSGGDDSARFALRFSDFSPEISSVSSRGVKLTWETPRPGSVGVYPGRGADASVARNRKRSTLILARGLRFRYARLLIYKTRINMDRSRFYGSLYSQQTSVAQGKNQDRQSSINEAIRFISHEALFEARVIITQSQCETHQTALHDEPCHRIYRPFILFNIRVDRLILCLR